MFRRALRTRSLRYAATATALGASVSSGVALAESPASPASSDESRMSSVSNSELLRSLVVYKACQYPLIVDHSPAILSALASVPIVKQLSEFVVRHTFFLQFVGGDSAADCLPVIRRMREDDVGTLLVYSVEVSHDESESHGLEITPARRQEAQEHVEEALRAIEVAGAENGRWCVAHGKTEGKEEVGGTWVAVKITGLMADPAVLLRLSNTIFALRDLRRSSTSDTYYPGTPSSFEVSIVASSPSPTPLVDLPLIPEGLSADDLKELGKLREDMTSIMRSARHHGVRIVIDSEHSWFEPAINAVTSCLAAEFNRPKAARRKAASSSSSRPKSWFSIGSSTSEVALSASLAEVVPENEPYYPDVQPLIYGTYQAYLRRNLDHLRHSFEHARENSYALGVKLVRGAYHEQECSRWQETRGNSTPPPVWSQKSETDSCFNSSSAWLLDRLAEDVKKGQTPSIGVIFATHNAESVSRVIDGMVERGLATKETGEGGKLVAGDEIRKRLCFGQLYGMSDPLTYYTSSAFKSGGSPLVLKYVPYGNLAEVMPYLGRRAVENKAVMAGEGGARAETQRAWKEMKRRWFMS